MIEQGCAREDQRESEHIYIIQSTTLHVIGSYKYGEHRIHTSRPFKVFTYNPQGTEILEKQSMHALFVSDLQMIMLHHQMIKTFCVINTDSIMLFLKEHIVTEVYKDNIENCQNYKLYATNTRHWTIICNKIFITYTVLKTKVSNNFFNKHVQWISLNIKLAIKHYAIQSIIQRQTTCLFS